VAVPELVGGQLPVGRHGCTLNDVEQAFVISEAFQGSSSRPDIWDGFQLGLRALTGAVRVYQVWIGGSFTTDKVDPGDIDVTYLIDGPDHFSRPVADRTVIEAFIQRVQDPSSGEVIRPHGLPIDSFVVDWWPYEPLLGDGQPWSEEHWWSYLSHRGHWDDWWLRRRTGAKGDPAKLEDSIPRRGFLEVTINDFIV
jgi:hypothetical protein